MVLIDIENLAATPSPTALDMELVMAELAEIVPGLAEAQVVIACSHRAAVTVAFAYPSARHLWRSGPNGADLALLDVLGNEHVEQRFEYLTKC
jgi:hypothetical protein